ncbi:hypothetical protein TUM4438_40730 [Shewanella sairae]|uniref:Uncharacterized protein n=1 Tax=Shewanella sairae TaxID=190310 RepID=A0ABQ4PQY9_9GAMM|nr:hypothetical protein [Shewanella sairae]MCL1132459.1 hypothetical protein [Shewanella sairae]GIU51362.1 hypothetical protein TUM4438_40730 [Shewanella sairae]
MNKIYELYSKVLPIKNGEYSVPELIDKLSELGNNYPESDFIIIYPAEVESFATQLKNEVDSLGLIEKRVRYISNTKKSKGSPLLIYVSSFEQYNCGALNINNHSSYSFGCSIRYNHNNNLVQPIKDN